VTGLHQPTSITPASSLCVGQETGQFASSIQSRRMLSSHTACAMVDKKRGEIQKASRTKNTVHRPPESFLAQATKEAYAFFATLTLFRTTSRLPFLATKVLNLSKSLSDFRFSMAARLVAHVDLFHFSTIPSLVSCLRTVPEPAPRGSFGRRNGVRVRCR
jgi:hypothetical protein